MRDPGSSEYAAYLDAYARAALRVPELAKAEVTGENLTTLAARALGVADARTQAPRPCGEVITAIRALVPAGARWC